MNRNEYTAKLAERLESIAKWIQQQTPDNGLTGASLNVEVSRKLWGCAEQLLIESDKLRGKRPY